VRGEGTEGATSGERGGEDGVRLVSRDARGVKPGGDQPGSICATHRHLEAVLVSRWSLLVSFWSSLVSSRSLPVSIPSNAYGGSSGTAPYALTSVFGTTTSLLPWPHCRLPRWMPA